MTKTRVMSIRDFVLEAKKECYANPDYEVEDFGIGTQRRRHRNEKLLYEDVVHTSDSRQSIRGEAVVFDGEQVRWAMQYCGGLTNKAITKANPLEVYSFLKKCLAKVDERNPIRGPIVDFEEGKLQYHLNINGTFNDFRGFERIEFEGCAVYKCNLQGRLMH